MDKIKFTFVSFVYNHEQYIIEHLESIKYLIDNYGDDYIFNIVIGDDGSKDNSVKLISLWLELNGNIFNNVEFIHDGINRGLPVNFERLSSYIETEYFKCLAGDDVFSNVNIFKDYQYLSNYECISAMPLFLIDGIVSEPRSHTFHMLASDIVFKNKPFIERFKKICVSNTPSLIYNLKFLKNKKVVNYVQSFKVTEDLPMWIKASQLYGNIKAKQLNSVHIYYRRTSGSIYLVQNKSFVDDKLRAYSDLLSMEMSFWSRFLLKNRRFCFKYEKFKFSKILNLNYYVYMFSIIKNINVILDNFNAIDTSIDSHQEHYDFLKNKSKVFKRKYLC
ncbi:glycosyltransferase [Aliivibrio fischeri]|uniref:Glycosyltransferase n=1 Tax=Aliivibrio fischeri TaxID=668 RepID=A0A844P0V3_ALIFS|nr:glycosyltransferase family 2 protein [Aliivibrio fischeri]MUK49011.1 glycosyltransferase [Aliivibrio fischeri]